MIQITRWSPDTCNCKIDYTWDDTIPQDQRVHTMRSVVPCAIHVGQAEPEAYQNVLSENQSKNMAIGLLVLNVPTLKDRASEVIWSFNIDRSINLSHPELTKQDKDFLNALAKPEIVKQVSFV